MSESMKLVHILFWPREIGAVPMVCVILQLQHILKGQRTKYFFLYASSHLCFSSASPHGIKKGVAQLSFSRSIHNHRY